MECEHPPPASPGDEVVVLAPSRPMPESVVEIGVRRLRERFDLSPVVYPSATADERLAPADRAAEIHRAFESDATAVFAVAGGEDQLRVLRHLDSDRLAATPTRFFGISDNTNLHAALSAAGVVSYYGGQFVPGVACDENLPAYTERYLERALFDDRIGEIEPAAEWTDGYYPFDADEGRAWEPNDGWTWAAPSDDEIAGRLWGGCLTVVAHLLAADRCVPDADAISGGVLALETSELRPSPYRVRSAIRCLGERDLLSKFDAAVIGRPKTRHREPRDDAERRAYREGQRDAILDACREYVPELPVVFDVDFGHTDPHVPVPIGGEIRISPSDRRIRFD